VARRSDEPARDDATTTRLPHDGAIVWQRWQRWRADGVDIARQRQLNAEGCRMEDVECRRMQKDAEWPNG
jgi:hypothetical protein